MVNVTCVQFNTIIINKSVTPVSNYIFTATADAQCTFPVLNYFNLSIHFKNIGVEKNAIIILISDYSRMRGRINFVIESLQ